MKYLLFITILFFSSCSRNHYPQFDYNKSKNPYIDAFKDHVFFSALKEAYKSDTLIFDLIEKKDVLNPFDGISGDGYKKAVEMGKNLIKNMPPVPAMCENCKNGENYYMATALHYYRSKEVNDSAIKYYKQEFKKGKLSGLPLKF